MTKKKQERREAAGRHRPNAEAREARRSTLPKRTPRALQDRSKYEGDGTVKED